MTRKIAPAPAGEYRSHYPLPRDWSVDLLASQLAAPVDAELAVGVRKMRLHGVDRQVQLVADFPVGPPSPGEPGHGLLLRAELDGRDAAGEAASTGAHGEGLVD